jgi:hypothetical protein
MIAAQDFGYPTLCAKVTTAVRIELKSALLAVNILTHAG